MPPCAVPSLMTAAKAAWDSHPIGGNINTSPGTHIYGVNWYPGHLDFYYDGMLVASASNASLSGGLIRFHRARCGLDSGLRLWRSSGTVPATMTVDYVRVFSIRTTALGPANQWGGLTELERVGIYIADQWRLGESSRVGGRAECDEQSIDHDHWQRQSVFPAAATIGNKGSYGLMTIAAELKKCFSKAWRNHIQPSFQDFAALSTRSRASFISGACWTKSGWRRRENCRKAGSRRGARPRKPVSIPAAAGSSHIDYAALEVETRKRGSDESRLEWAFAHGRQPSEEEIEVWNGFMTKLGWRDGRTQRLNETARDRPARRRGAD